MRLEIETVFNGMLENPLSIDRLIVYHIEIKPGVQPTYTLNNTYTNPSLQKEYKNLQMKAGTAPSQEIIEGLQNMKQRLEASTTSKSFHFNEATPVTVIGNRDMAVWTPDQPDSLVKQILDDDGIPIKGRFEFVWDTEGRCDGTYVLVWEWRTETDLLQAHNTFYLHADKPLLTADKLAYTPENKYNMLLDLYTPEMYKRQVTSTDKTPEVIKRLNESIAEGFTMLEDMANQLGSMLEPNLVHKSMLPVLANLFGLKLRSDDPNRWRAQIKRAVALHKRKGTLFGLHEALDQAGIHLLKLTRLWQVVSPYICTNAFVIPEEGRLTPILGTLSKMPHEITKLQLKASDGEFLNIPQECIMIVPPVDPTDKPSLVWQSHILENPIHLYPQDVVLITYTTAKIPTERKAIEDYIQSLPLADDRPDTTPAKNWNVRLIEDDDALFDVIIPTRFPAMSPQVFGKIRTKFLYSEQVYNMDTYNGSLRNSFVPCDLDNTFVDQCTACQSSRFNVDLEIENLSDQRIEEAREIIRDYSPFHARLHSITIAGAVNEFVLPPQEDVGCLVQTNATKQVTKVSQSEMIDYEIEWRDGTKEKNEVKQ